MSERSIFSNLVRQPDGAFSALYGPYRLQSALQPILAEQADGRLRIAVFKGFVRVSVAGQPCSPAEFFETVPPQERAAVDDLCRSLHILNTGMLGHKDVTLIVSFHAGLSLTDQAMRHEVERLRLCAREAGLPAAAIACEIREHPRDDPATLARFAACLRKGGFAIALDDYAGEDRDLERVRRLKPQFVTFDPAWLYGFAKNSAGLALLRVVIGQFTRKGIHAIACGIEEPDMLELCRRMGCPLMQGYLLARPQLAPATFDFAFPQGARAGDPGIAPLAQTHAARPARQFGRRGLQNG